MNEKRRQNIRQAVDLIERAKDIVSDAKWEEQDALDNMPENLQGSSRYSSIEDALDALEEAEGSLSDAQEHLNDALDQ